MQTPAPCSWRYGYGYASTSPVCSKTPTPTVRGGHLPKPFQRVDSLLEKTKVRFDTTHHLCLPQNDAQPTSSQRGGGPLKATQPKPTPLLALRWSS